MLRHIRYGFLLLLVGLLGINNVQAQINPNPRCQTLNTGYGNLYWRSRWLDNDTIEFLDWNGANGSSTLSPTKTTWYQYHATTGVLETLDYNPFDQLKIAGNKLVDTPLKSVQAGLEGLYEYVNISPNQDFVIYPRQDETSQDMWLIDTRSKTEVPLGIGLGYPKVFWSADEQKFILTNTDRAANYLTPMQLVTLVDGKITVQQLDKIKLLSDIIPISKNYYLHGISPDGRYLLITPEYATYETWAVDLVNQKAHILGFYIYGETDVVWTSPSEFIGIADKLGAIRYNIVNGMQEVLAQPNEIGLYDIRLNMIGSKLPKDAFIAGGHNLSPDGHYSIAHGQRDMKSQIVVCKIY